MRKLKGEREVKKYELEGFFNKVRSIIADSCPHKHRHDEHTWTFGSRKLLRPLSLKVAIDKLLSLGTLGATLTTVMFAGMVVGCWVYFTVLHMLPWEIRCVGMWGLIAGLAIGVAVYNPEGKAG